MVSKHILMNSTAKSSVRRLVAYITDPQDKVSRIERVSVQNCIADDAINAAREMEAVQLLNKRAKADKTYHLLLSFPAGEEPTAEQLQSIEEDVCAALGYTAHQRISVVHRDTDNLHVHLAINKIHPQKLTIHEPRRDFQILAKAAELVEETYRLVKTNHTPKKTVSENRMDDAEKMSGQETLASYIRAHCLNELQAARTWDEVREICAKNGVALQLRGNGMVFTQVREDGDVNAVKASTVDRNLSKAKMEARLGAFRDPVEQATNKTVDKQICRAPTLERVNGRETLALWTRYTQARISWQEQSAAEKVRVTDERARRKQLIDALYKVEKAGPRKSCVPYWQRRYRLLELRTELAGRQKAFGKTNRRVSGYLEWLQQQAMAGDGDALAALRRRAFGLAKQGNAFLTKDGLDGGDWAIDTVTKQGTVIYAVGQDVIRDRGELFHVSIGAKAETLVMAMKMAANRSGNCLIVAGDEAFREQCLQMSVSANLQITFSDPALETRRKNMTEAQKLELAKEPLKGGGREK